MEIVKDWSCTIKQDARDATVVAAYRRLFGDRLPDGAQYWTLGGLSADADGGPLRGSEVDHVTRIGLCRLDQYHSVERDPAIHEANRAAWPEANWYQGDFLEVLEDQWASGDFAPAVVNFDSMWTPKEGAVQASAALDILGEWHAREGRGPLLFAFNVILYHTYRARSWTPDEALAPLYRKSPFKRAVTERQWRRSNQCFRYSRSQTTMGTFLYYLSAKG